MFNKTFDTLKKRTSQVADGIIQKVETGVKAVNAELNKKNKDGTDDLGGFGDGMYDDPIGPAQGPVLVRYSIQNDGIENREFAAFVLPLEIVGGRQVTVGIVRKQFPLSGRFHFRFRAPTQDRSFGGYTWFDLAADDEPVPVYRGAIAMKALKLPEEAAQRVLEPIKNGGLFFAAPVGNAGGFGSRQGSVAADLEGLESGFFEDDHRSPSSNYSPPSRSPEPSRSPQPLTPERTMSPPPSAPSPPRPPDNLMEMDFGGSAAPPGGSVPSAAPPPKVPVPDRNTLVMQREAETQRRVTEMAAQAKAVASKEEATKTGKLDANSKLGPMLDNWAKTSDGKFKDIRTLLSTMHEVTWEGANWKPVTLADLLAPGAIKKNYRKAIIIAHPDKSQDESYEQQVRADKIFQALNEAFKVSGEG